MRLTHIINGIKVETYNDVVNKLKKNDEKYEFFLDNIENSIYITDRLIFIRKNDEYCFKLEISSNSRCEIYLKNEDKTFNINVKNAKYTKSNEKIAFTYKLETDEDEHQIILEIGD